MCTCGAEDEREFDYIEGSERGRHRWGELKVEWAACKDGDMQSPMDLSSQRVKVIKKPPPLGINYKPHNATFTNRVGGHSKSVEPTYFILKKRRR